MKLEAKTPTERRLKEYLDANASEALREKIAALPDGARFNLGAAWTFCTGEARKKLNSRSGFLEDEVVFGWLVHYYEDVAPAEAAKPAPAKAANEKKASEAPGKSPKKRTHDTEPAKAGVGKNLQPAARAGSSKSRTKGRGCSTPPETEASLEPSPTTQDGACAPSAVASSAPPPEPVCLGTGSRSTGGGAVSSPDPAADREAAMAPAERAAESGFSFALFDSEGGAS